METNRVALQIMRHDSTIVSSEVGILRRRGCSVTNHEARLIDHGDDGYFVEM